MPCTLIFAILFLSIEKSGPVDPIGFCFSIARAKLWFLICDISSRAFHTLRVHNLRRPLPLQRCGELPKCDASTGLNEFLFYGSQTTSFALRSCRFYIEHKYHGPADTLARVLRQDVRRESDESCPPSGRIRRSPIYAVSSVMLRHIRNCIFLVSTEISFRLRLNCRI